MQRFDRRHLLLGREHAALEFDCGEAVFVDDPTGLRDDAVRVEGLAERVGLGAGVAGPLVEEVSAERHGIAHRATEQIRYRPARGVTLHVEARDLERRQHLVDSTGSRDHPGRADGAGVAAEPLVDGGANRVEREHVQTGDGVGGRFKPCQVRPVGIGLAEPHQTGIGVQLNDGAKRVGLVHADGIQQRWVDERDRGDTGGGDADLALRHRYRASASAPASTVRPASMIERSSARSSEDGITRGGRTGPAGMPSKVTPALTSETA